MMDQPVTSPVPVCEPPVGPLLDKHLCKSSLPLSTSVNLENELEKTEEIFIPASEHHGNNLIFEFPLKPTKYSCLSCCTCDSVALVLVLGSDGIKTVLQLTRGIRISSGDETKFFVTPFVADVDSHKLGMGVEETIYKTNNVSKHMLL